MLFLYFPVDETRTERVYMGHALEFDEYEDDNEIEVRTCSGRFNLRRHPISGGWTHRDGIDVLDADLVRPD